MFKKLVFLQDKYFPFTLFSFIYFLYHIQEEITSITFNVWEFSQAKTFRPIHHSFITPNSLYLLVWDLRKKVETLKQWLQSIEVCFISLNPFENRLYKGYKHNVIVNVIKKWMFNRFCSTFALLPATYPITCQLSLIYCVITVLVLPVHTTAFLLTLNSLSPCIILLFWRFVVLQAAVTL